FILMLRPLPFSTLFPYTTLFRSAVCRPVGHPAQVMIYDISPPVSDRLAVWPGDTPPSRQVLCDLKRGDTITLSSVNATVHLGSQDRKSTRLNSSHSQISYAVFCL